MLNNYLKMNGNERHSFHCLVSGTRGLVLQPPCIASLHTLPPVAVTFPLLLSPPLFPQRTPPTHYKMGFSPSSSCLILWWHLASLTFLKCGAIEKAWVLKHRDPGLNLCSSSICSLYELGQVRHLLKSLLLLTWSFWCLFLGVVGRVKWDFVCEALSLVPGL